MNTPAALLKRALDQIDTLVAVTPTESQHDPTPCDEYDVTALINHLVVIANRISAAAAPGGHHGVPADPGWTSAGARARAAIDDADPEALADLPFGRMPLRAGFAAYVGELTTHGWDLAAALGRRDLLDESLGEAAAAIVISRIPAGPRDEMPFAEVVPVPDDAPAYDRLAGWMGRDPGSW
jgi:uncharacterized protein (TIGR03086 family)